MKYGWRRDNPDFRDYSFALTDIKPAPEVDLRHLMPAVYDQGQLGSCTANAIAGALEFDEKLEKEKASVPSRLYIYYQERLIEGTVESDSGASIRDGIKSVVKTGVPPEKIWPYVISRFAVPPSAAANKAAPLGKATQYKAVAQDSTLRALRIALTAGYPVVFGFTVYSSFESQAVAKTGIVPMPKTSESVAGGHAVLAVGYNDSHIICRNSWGKDWGLRGYFYIPYAYLANPKLASDFWTIEKVV